MEIASLFATLGLKPDEHSWKRGEELIENVKRGLEIFVGFEAVKYIGELVNKTGEAAIASERLAQKLGTTSESIQKLGYAANVSGASVEDLQTFMQHMSLQMAEAKKTGTGPLVDALSTLHISFASFSKLSADEKVEVLADAFKKAGPEVNKTAVAMQLGGRSGTALIPMLNRGGAAVRELGEEFKEMGGVIDGDATKSFEELEETEKKLGATMTGIKNQAVIALLPAIKEMAESLLEWVKANKEVIASTIKGVVDALATAFSALGTVIGTVGDVVQWFIEHAEIGKAVLIALGVVIAALAAEAAAAWIIGFAPIIGVVAAIAALILVVQDVWKSITTGKGITADVFRWISGKVHGVWESFKSFGRSIGDFFTGIASSIKQAFVDFFDWVVAKAEAVGGAIRNAPGIKQVLDATHALGTGAGHIARALTGGGTPEDEAYDAISEVRTAGDAPTVNNNNVNANFTINSATGDPKAIGDEVDRRLGTFWNNQLRAAHADTGGADVP